MYKYYYYYGELVKCYSLWYYSRYELPETTKGTLWPSPSVFLFLEPPTRLRAETMSVNSCLLDKKKTLAAARCS